MSESEDFTYKFNSSTPGLLCVCMHLTLSLLGGIPFLQFAAVSVLLTFLTCVSCQASEGISVCDAHV